MGVHLNLLFALWRGVTINTESIWMARAKSTRLFRKQWCDFLSSLHTWQYRAWAQFMPCITLWRHLLSAGAKDPFKTILIKAAEAIVDMRPRLEAIENALRSQTSTIGQPCNSFDDGNIAQSNSFHDQEITDQARNAPSTFTWLLIGLYTQLCTLWAGCMKG